MSRCRGVLVSWEETKGETRLSAATAALQEQLTGRSSEISDIGDHSQ